MRHRVTLQFTAGGPTVSAEWAEEPTARTTWRAWVGLYGDERAVIRLVQDIGDHQRLLTAWEDGRVIEAEHQEPTSPLTQNC